MSQSREWTGRFISGLAELPISFVFDGGATSGIPPEWQPVTSRRRVDANIIETVFEGTEAGSGLNLRVECTEYQDYPVVEWVAWFSNKGHETTPVISDILAVDGAFTGSSPVLYHCNGDFNSEEGYTPWRLRCALETRWALPPTVAGPATAHSPTTASCSRAAVCRWPSAGPDSGRPVLRD